MGDSTKSFASFQIKNSWNDLYLLFWKTRDKKIIPSQQVKCQVSINCLLIIWGVRIKCCSLKSTVCKKAGWGVAVAGNFESDLQWQSQLVKVPDWFLRPLNCGEGLPRKTPGSAHMTHPGFSLESTLTYGEMPQALVTPPCSSVLSGIESEVC